MLNTKHTITLREKHVLWSIRDSDITRRKRNYKKICKYLDSKYDFFGFRYNVNSKFCYSSAKDIPFSHFTTDDIVARRRKDGAIFTVDVNVSCRKIYNEFEVTDADKIEKFKRAINKRINMEPNCE